MKNKTKLAGFCPVDSGQIMVIDPCYALMDEYDDTDGRYPVFVDVNEDGRVVELRIAFDGIRHDDYKVMMDQEEKEGII
jgi:hypothetical protein